MNQTPGMRIALLEDDESQRLLMERLLGNAGYICRAFALGKNMVSVLGRESFDLCVLDWEVPDLSGEQVLMWIREHVKEPLPVLFVTARDTEGDIVRALDAGADDYMVKPVGERELLARVAALLRRVRGAKPVAQDYAVGEFHFDLRLRTLTRAGELLKLTNKDFDVALFLLRNIGRLLSRGHIYESVWGRSANVNSRTVDTHVSRVRVKLGLMLQNGWQVTSVYQYGYRLERLADPAAPEPAQPDSVAPA